MRSPSSGIAAALSAPGSFPGFLLEITLTTGQVLRRTSLDAVFSYDGEQWIPLDLQMPALSWDGGVLKPGRLVVGDADLTFWALALDLALADAGVRLWQVYASAQDEAEPVFSGRVSSIARRGLTVEIALTNDSDTVTAPRLRVQQVVSSTFLMPAGTVLNIGGQVWTIDRPTSGAG